MNITLFLLLSVLFNIYIHFMAFLYRPALEHGRKGISSAGGRSREDLEAERERQQIMNEFYQTEMNELNDESVDHEPEDAHLFKN